MAKKIINYAKVGLTVWLIMVALWFLVISTPGDRLASYAPLGILLSVIAILETVTHFFNYSNPHYPHKKQIAALVLLVLAIISVFYMALNYTSDFERDDAEAPCEYTYKDAHECIERKGWTCVHYTGLGLGRCDYCQKLECPAPE